jgi:hypothetical protein
MAEEQKFPKPIEFEYSLKRFKYEVPQGQEWIAALLLRQENQLIGLQIYIREIEKSTTIIRWIMIISVVFSVIGGIIWGIRLGR